MTLVMKISPDLELRLKHTARQRGLEIDQCVLRLLEESLSRTTETSRSPLEDDPLMAMAGVDDYEPAAVDEVVYW